MLVCQVKSNQESRFSMIPSKTQCQYCNLKTNKGKLGWRRPINDNYVTSWRKGTFASLSVLLHHCTSHRNNSRSNVFFDSSLWHKKCNTKNWEILPDLCKQLNRIYTFKICCKKYWLLHLLTIFFHWFQIPDTFKIWSKYASQMIFCVCCFCCHLFGSAHISTAICLVARCGVVDRFYCMMFHARVEQKYRVTILLWKIIKC